MVRAVQADQVAATRGDLVRVLMAKNVDLTPPATLAQAQRLAAHRDALLATPVLTHDTLRALRGDAKASSTRTWLTRRRENHELFTVAHNGRTLIPAFQLDDDAHPRPELQPVLEALAAGGVTGWPLWAWLTMPSSLLSGRRPGAAGSPRTAAGGACGAALRDGQRRLTPEMACPPVDLDCPDPAGCPVATSLPTVAHVHPACSHRVVPGV